MKFVLHIVLLLSLFEGFFALPIPNAAKPRQNFLSKFQWKKYLPIVGTIGILGAAGAVYFIGTKADEAIAAIQKVQTDPMHGKYLMLSEGEREYVEKRAKLFGEELDERGKAIVEFTDKVHGWPKLEMPDTTGMAERDVRQLKAAYKRLDKAMKKIEKAKAKESEVNEQKEEVFERRRKAQMHAAIIAATDWKEAVTKAREQSVAP